VFPLQEFKFLLALTAALLVFAALAWWFLSRPRPSPEERERMRRLAVNQTRRALEGVITEADENMIHYRYELRGVSYFASQDVSSLRDRLPDDPPRLIGPAGVRYDPRNPANSIVVCEDWSGFTVRAAEPARNPTSEEQNA